MLIRKPIAKAMKDPFDLFLRDDPVCNPITETNREEPSFENIVIVLCTLAIISVCVSGINRFIRDPTRIATNRIPAIPSEILQIRILPMPKPAIMIKKRRLMGEINIWGIYIILHPTVAHTKGECGL